MSLLGYIMGKIFFRLLVISSFLLLAGILPQAVFAGVIFENNAVYKLTCSPGPVFSRSIDKGLTFSSKKQIASSTEEASFPHIIREKTLLEAYWYVSGRLYLSFSSDNGDTWSRPESIYTFNSKPSSLAVIKHNRKTLLVWANGQNKLLSSFSEALPYFSVPFAVNTASIPEGVPAVSSNSGHVFVVWKDKTTKQLRFCESFDFGRTYTAPKEVASSFTEQSLPKAASQNSNVLCSWTVFDGIAHKLMGAKKTAGSSAFGRPFEIASSSTRVPALDVALSPQLACFAAWSADSMLNFSRSFFSGTKWSSPQRELVASEESFSVKILSSSGTVMVRTGDSIRTMALPQLRGLTSKTPDGYVFASSGPIVTFEADPVQDADTFLYSTRLGKTENLSSFAEHIVQYPIASFAEPLADGKYYYKIYAWNGISSFESQTRSFAIDTSPKVFMLSVEKPLTSSWFKKGSILVFEASVPDTGFFIEDDTEALAYLNGSTAEASLYFDKGKNKVLGMIKVPQGIPQKENDLEVSLPLPDGTFAKAVTKLNIDLVEPGLAFSSKEPVLYSNSGKRVLIELFDDGSGPDNKNSSVKLFRDSSTVEGSCSAGAGEKELVFEPAAVLPDGTYKLEAHVRDLAGNISKPVTAALVIDTVVPVITLYEELPKTLGRSSLALTGRIDKPSVKRIFVSVNGKQSKEQSVSSDGTFRLGIGLEKGENKIVISAKDPAQNTANVSGTIICTAVSSSAIFEFDGKRISEGDYVAPSLSSVKITDSSGAPFASASVKLDSIDIAYDTSTGAASVGKLSTGKHKLEVETPSQTYSLEFFSEGSLCFKDLLPCPNPFNPSLGASKITYNLSMPAQVRLYIFDQTGRLVTSVRAFGTAGYNDNLEWDGKLSTGENAANGIYLVKVLAEESGQATAFAKGKVIVLR